MYFRPFFRPDTKRIINMSARQSLNLNSVADNFAISRPAISRHIKILTECGPIVIRQQAEKDIAKQNFNNLIKFLNG